MWELNPASFDRLLQKLSPDPERAAAEYEALRSRLTKFFEWRRCTDPELLADRTLDRLAQRLDGGEDVEHLYSYCCGIARHLMLESRRSSDQETAVASHLLLMQVSPRGAGDAALQSLQECLRQLPARSRRLVLEYYAEEKQRKIEHRRELARSLDIPVTALRSRAFRVRAWLENCVGKSLDHRKAP